MRYRAMPGVIFVSVCESLFLVKADEIIRINEMTGLCWEKLKKVQMWTSLSQWLQRIMRLRI